MQDFKIYLKDYQYSKAFDSQDIQSTLNNAISKKTLTLEYMKSVLNVPEETPNKLTAKGYDFYFKDGLLIKFASNDGLNVWAKEWLENDPSIYKIYENEAKKYWGSDKEKIISEINIQADAYATTPLDKIQEFYKLHQYPSGYINYKMLLVAHCNETISLTEFKTINHGRYKLSSDITNGQEKQITYKVLNTIYTFDKNGKFINAFTRNN